MFYIYNIFVGLKQSSKILELHIFVIFVVVINPSKQNFSRTLASALMHKASCNNSYYSIPDRALLVKSFTF